MALACGLHTVFRPCRKTARFFKAKDVGRIALYAYEDGAGRLEIIAWVFVKLGVGDYLCTASIVYRFALAVLDAIQDVAVAIAAAKVIEAIVKWLLESAVSKIPQVRWALALLILLLLAVQEIAELADRLIGEVGKIKEVVDFFIALCEMKGTFK